MLTALEVIRTTWAGVVPAPIRTSRWRHIGSLTQTRLAMRKCAFLQESVPKTHMIPLPHRGFHVLGMTDNIIPRTPAEQWPDHPQAATTWTTLACELRPVIIRGCFRPRVIVVAPKKPGALYVCIITVQGVDIGTRTRAPVVAIVGFLLETTRRILSNAHL